MQRNVDVRTPESIALTYELAGLGSRFLAVFIDLLVQLLVFGALITGLLVWATHLPAALKHPVHTAAEKTSEAIAIAILVVVIFAIFFGYFILFEGLWNGQTPGKKLLGIRVVRDGGYPIDMGAALVRNLIRVGEFILGYYLLSAISTVLSPENKRLGDIAAGTIVVRDARLTLPSALNPDTTQPIYAPTAYLSGEERALVKRFLDRRDALAVDRRQQLAAQLAARVRDRVPNDLQRLDDESLLERL
jgi:uncharacterized RDD family membrane protein YckC